MSEYLPYMTAVFLGTILGVLSAVAVLLVLYGIGRGFLWLLDIVLATTWDKWRDR